MNRSDLPRIAAQGRKVDGELDKHGHVLWASTYDWQSPLRSGGAKGCKGDHADPTAGSVITPDPLALLHGELKALLRLKDRVDADLLALVNKVLPIDPNAVDRSRLSQVPACIVCSGPAVPVRRGLCPACYQAWLRADMPDLEGFKRTRAKRLEDEQRVRHEHELESAAGVLHATENTA